MRISEIINEEVNPDIRHPEFEHEQQIGDYLYTAKTHISPSGVITYLLIKCYDGNNLIARADFELRVKMGKKWLESENTMVAKQYQQQGIASTMYAYAKMLGNDIKPSPDQSDMGKAMWKGWKDSGDAKHLTNEEVNPDIYHPNFKHEVEMHGYRYVATADQSSGYGNELKISVFDGKKQIAVAEFIEEPHDKALISANTQVSDGYEGQGIATNMYAYAKMLGNDIIPSDNQTDQGETMWKSWNQSGQSKHILPKGHRGY